MAESETGGGAAQDINLFPQRVGERLRVARVAAGLDLNDVATSTRVPMRHLAAIEQSDYSELPSPTYAVGFVRSYARAVGADEASMAAAIRAELGRAPIGQVDPTPYEPVDPARLPSRLLAWTAAFIGLIGLIGYMVWRSTMFGGHASDAVANAPAPVANTRGITPIPPAPPKDQVVLTAVSPVWLRIYDRADKKLLEKEMAAGETFTVPPDADTPMVRTGRPDAIRVTVNGHQVAPLGRPEQTIMDVGVSAAALAARAPVALGIGGNRGNAVPQRTDISPVRTPPRL